MPLINLSTLLVFFIVKAFIVKNAFGLRLLPFLTLLISTHPCTSCEKETHAQFRARYKAHANRLGILQGVDIRTLSNDDLKNAVLPYLTGEQQKESLSEEDVSKALTKPKEQSSTHRHSNMALAEALNKKELTKTIRAEALTLGIDKARCAHMEVSELQKEIEQVKALRKEALRLGIEENRIINMEMYELQREIQERKAQSFSSLSKKGKAQTRSLKK